MRQSIPIYLVAIVFFVWLAVSSAHRPDNEVAGICALFLSIIFVQRLVNTKFASEVTRRRVLGVMLWMCFLLIVVFAFLRFSYFVPTSSIWATNILVLLLPVYSEYKKTVKPADGKSKTTGA